MLDLVGNDPIIRTMDRSMTLASRRMGLIAGNIANLDTPGYHTRDFSFEEALKAELGQGDGKNLPIARTSAMHFSASGSASLPPTGDPIRPNYERNDGNDVSLDRESTLLARTQTTYQLSSSFAQAQLRRIYQAIRDGSR